jgi:hypothetical protein
MKLYHNANQHQSHWRGTLVVSVATALLSVTRICFSSAYLVYSLEHEQREKES